MEQPVIGVRRPAARRWLDAARHGQAAGTALCAVLAACLLLCIWGYTAVRLDDEARLYLDRLQAAYPEAHAAWLRARARP